MCFGFPSTYSMTDELVQILSFLKIDDVSFNMN
jgi:hypothetical protein